ncbi:hypothetical protein [Bacillus tuaregi]|uniref:hypothetical protein n=1 Tax=Bacillus tuaregi TaxID=1816695 RepID=UPI0008F7F4AF|nr:hypothetical protein [Bacillus tuaregi]
MEVGTRIAQIQNVMDQNIESIEKLITAYEENIHDHPAMTEDEILLLKLWLRDNILRYWVNALQQSLRGMDDSNRTDILQLLNQFERPIADYMNRELTL